MTNRPSQHAGAAGGRPAARGLAGARLSMKPAAAVGLAAACLLAIASPLEAQGSASHAASASSRPGLAAAGGTERSWGDAVALRAAKASPPGWMGREDLASLRSIAADLAAEREERALEKWNRFISAAARRGQIRSADQARPLFDLALRWAFLDSDPDLKPLADRVRRADEVREAARTKLYRTSMRTRGVHRDPGVGRKVSPPATRTDDGARASKLDVEAAELEAGAAERRYRAAVLRLQEATSLRTARVQVLSSAAKAAHDVAMNAIRNVRA